MNDFRCQKCGREFRSERGLKTHQTRMHFDEYVLTNTFRSAPWTNEIDPVGSSLDEPVGRSLDEPVGPVPFVEDEPAAPEPTAPFSKEPTAPFLEEPAAPFLNEPAGPVLHEVNPAGPAPHVHEVKPAGPAPSDPIELAQATISEHMSVREPAPDVRARQQRKREFINAMGGPVFDDPEGRWHFHRVHYTPDEMRLTEFSIKFPDYQPVTPEEFRKRWPGKPFVERGGLVSVGGDLVLFKCPKERFDERREFVSELAQERIGLGKNPDAAPFREGIKNTGGGVVLTEEEYNVSVFRGDRAGDAERLKEHLGDRRRRT